MRTNYVTYNFVLCISSQTYKALKTEILPTMRVPWVR